MLFHPSVVSRLPPDRRPPRLGRLLLQVALVAVAVVALLALAAAWIVR